MPSFELIDKTELYITGDIGFVITAKRFCEELRAVKTPNILVHIDSIGGSTFDGITIYNALTDYKGKKTAIIDGVCMSAASYILMAFDEIIAKPNSLIMIHNPLVEAVSGNAADLTKVVSTLTELNKMYINAYCARTNKSPEEIKSFMDNETTFTADEALAAHFIDRIDGVAKQPISKASLTSALNVRYAAYAKTFKTQPLKIMTDLTNIKAEADKPIDDKPVETPAEPIKEESFTVEQAQAIADEAKIINTQEAFNLAIQQITDAIKDIEDKTAFQPILDELNALIVTPKVEDKPVEPEAKAEAKQPSAYDNEVARKNAIMSFATDLNKDGSLNDVLISALSSDMSLDDFKTAACKKLAIAKSKTNFRAMLSASAKPLSLSTNEQPASTQPTLKRKSDYISYYKDLVASNKQDEATAFYKKYKNIF